MLATFVASLISCSLVSAQFVCNCHCKIIDYYGLDVNGTTTCWYLKPGTHYGGITVTNGVTLHMAQDTGLPVKKYRFTGCTLQCNNGGNVLREGSTGVPPPTTILDSTYVKEICVDIPESGKKPENHGKCG
jgi:hypothetical protein